MVEFLKATKEKVGDVVPPRHTIRFFLLAMVSFSETDLLNLHIQKSHFQGLIIMRWNFKKHRDKDLWKRSAYLLQSDELPEVLFPIAVPTWG